MNLDTHNTLGELLDQAGALEVDASKASILCQPLVYGGRRAVVLVGFDEAADLLIRIANRLLQQRGMYLDPRSDGPIAQGAEGA